MKINQIENFKEKIKNIPTEEWSGAARVVIEAKRKETRVAGWLPSFLNGRREVEERVVALVEEKRTQRDAN